MCDASGIDKSFKSSVFERIVIIEECLLEDWLLINYIVQMYNIGANPRKQQIK